MTGYVGLGQDYGHVKKPTAIAMALRAACSGILKYKIALTPADRDGSGQNDSAGIRTRVGRRMRDGKRP